MKKEGSNIKLDISVSVFFPAYNEELNIKESVLRALSTLSKIATEYEIIIVNDGSTDKTGNIAESLSLKYSFIRVIHHSYNKGYGAALRTGFSSCKYPIIFFTDSDNQFDIAEIVKLIPYINKYDIVAGFRYNRSDPLFRSINAYFWNRLVDKLFKTDLKDINCAFKLFKREVLQSISIKSMGALVNTEIITKAKQKGFKIKEVGVIHYPRIAGKQSGANIKVILRAFKELFQLYSELRSNYVL